MEAEEKKRILEAQKKAEDEAIEAAKKKAEEEEKVIKATLEAKLKKEADERKA
jgi:hypothetical protein